MIGIMVQFADGTSKGTSFSDEGEAVEFCRKLLSAGAFVSFTVSLIPGGA